MGASNLVSFSSAEGREVIANADPEFRFLRNMPKDSDEVKVVARAALLSKLATHGRSKLCSSLKVMLIV